MEINDDVRPGDLRRCDEGEEFARIVFVRRVLPTHAIVSLVHSEPENATASDLVIPAKIATAWSPVIQENIIGCVYACQIRLLVARLPDGWELLASRGPELASPADSRWRFKEREIRDIRKLTDKTWADLIGES